MLEAERQLKELGLADENDQSYLDKLPPGWKDLSWEATVALELEDLLPPVISDFTGHLITKDIGALYGLFKIFGLTDPQDMQHICRFVAHIVNIKVKKSSEHIKEQKRREDQKQRAKSGQKSIGSSSRRK